MDAIIDTVVKWAAFLAAIGAIVGVVVKLFQLVRSMLDKLDEIQKEQRETYIQTLRLTIMSEEMPLEERIAAGDKYVADGRNGAVRHKYEELIDRLDGGNKSA